VREVTAFITKRVYLYLYELNLEAGGSWSREGEPERGKGSAERVHLCHRCPRKKRKKKKRGKRSAIDALGEKRKKGKRKKRQVRARQCGVRVHLCQIRKGGKKEKKERERLGGARPSLP
jgi:hypothetical protein